MTVPDYSPRMLSLFLAARAVAGTLDEVRGTARVRAAAFRLARAGRLKDGAGRARIWAACGVFPADHGVRLTDDGGQEPGSSFGGNATGERMR